MTPAYKEGLGHVAFGMGLIGLFGLAFGTYRRGKEAKEAV